MTTEHPITPPPELVRQWHDSWFQAKVKHLGSHEYIATQAARWGADQQLEQCVAWLDGYEHEGWAAEMMRNACRPKPPSLAEEALVACKRSAFGIPGDRDTIRRALERLKELEKGNE